MGYGLGFCLFLSLVLARTISILGALVTAEDQLAALKAKVTVCQFIDGLSIKKYHIRPPLDQRTKCKRMRSRRELSNWRRPNVTLVRLEAVEGCVVELTRPAETLKKQAKQQGLEYDRLTGELQKLSGSSDKRKD